MNYESYSRGFNDGAMLSRKVPCVAPFLVFADAVGYKPPSFKHPTREAAAKEAERLANLNPGVNYYVVGSLSVARSERPVATTRSLV